MENIDLIVMLDVKGLQDKQILEKHLTKEGFDIVPNEEFVYTGVSTTTTFSTKAYILEVFKEGLLKAKFDECSMIFLLNETPYPAYKYDKKINDFEEVK